MAEVQLCVVSCARRWDCVHGRRVVFLFAERGNRPQLVGFEPRPLPPLPAPRRRESPFMAAPFLLDHEFDQQYENNNL